MYACLCLHSVFVVYCDKVNIIYSNQPVNQLINHFVNLSTTLKKSFLFTKVKSEAAILGKLNTNKKKNHNNYMYNYHILFILLGCSCQNMSPKSQSICPFPGNKKRILYTFSILESMFLDFFGSTNKLILGYLITILLASSSNPGTTTLAWLIMFGHVYFDLYLFCSVNQEFLNLPESLVWARLFLFSC